MIEFICRLFVTTDRGNYIHTYIHFEYVLRVTVRARRSTEKKILTRKKQLSDHWERQNTDVTYFLN
jgi:hypothetical protein